MQDIFHLLKMYLYFFHLLCMNILPGLHEGQNKLLDPRELESGMFLRHHVGVEPKSFARTTVA